MTDAWFLAGAIALGLVLLLVKAARCARSGAFTASARSSGVAHHPPTRTGRRRD